MVENFQDVSLPGLSHLTLFESVHFRIWNRLLREAKYAHSLVSHHPHLINVEALLRWTKNTSNEVTSDSLEMEANKDPFQEFMADTHMQICPS